MNATLNRSSGKYHATFRALRLLLIMKKDADKKKHNILLIDIGRRVLYSNLLLGTDVNKDFGGVVRSHRAALSFKVSHRATKLVLGVGDSSRLPMLRFYADRHQSVGGIMTLRGYPCFGLRAFQQEMN